MGLRVVTAKKGHGRALITTHGWRSGKKQQEQNKFKAIDSNPEMFMNTTWCCPNLEHKSNSWKRKLK